MVLVVNITKDQLIAIKNNNILGSGNFSKVYDVSGNEILSFGNKMLLICQTIHCF